MKIIQVVDEDSEIRWGVFLDITECSRIFSLVTLSDFDDRSFDVSVKAVPWDTPVAGLPAEDEDLVVARAAGCELRSGRFLLVPEGVVFVCNVAVRSGLPLPNNVRRLHKRRK